MSPKGAFNSMIIIIICQIKCNADAQILFVYLETYTDSTSLSKYFSTSVLAPISNTYNSSFFSG